MCGKAEDKILAAILAAVGLTIFFSAVGDQIIYPVLAYTGIVLVFIKYLVAVLFMGAAKMIMWKSCCKPSMEAPVRAPARRRRRR